MSGFLQHLASLALQARPAGAARPSLPPHFAPPPVAMAGERDPSVPGWSAAPSPATAALAPPERGVRGRARADGASQSVAEGTSEAQGRVTQVGAPGAAGPHPLDVPSPARVTLPAARQAGREPATIARPSRASGDVQPPASSPAGLPLVDAALRAPASPATIAEPAAARPSRRLPLRDGVVAGRLVATRAEPRPVIHVTIDRIDLRAPAPSPKPAAEPRRPPPQPSVSLGDYLRGGAGGHG